MIDRITEIGAELISDDTAGYDHVGLVENILNFKLNSLVEVTGLPFVNSTRVYDGIGGPTEVAAAVAVIWSPLTLGVPALLSTRKSL